MGINDTNKYDMVWGKNVGNSEKVCISDYQMNRPGLSPAKSLYSEKWNSTDILSTCAASVAEWSRYMLSFLCENQIKKSLAICSRSWASCPFTRHLCVHIYTANKV